MDANELKEKLVEYKLPVLMLLVAAGAGAFAYFRADDAVALQAERDAEEARLEVLKYNDLNGARVQRGGSMRQIEVDLNEAKSLYQTVEARAIDFESSISAQSFFSDLIRNPGVKFETIPTLVAAPAATLAKPFAIGSYVIQGEGSSASILAFAKKCEEGTAKSIRIERIQLSSKDADATGKGGVVTCSLTLRAWGRRGDLVAPKGEAKPGKIMPAAERAKKLAAAREALRLQVSAPLNKHLLDGPGIGTGPGTVTGGDIAAGSLEAALRQLKITETMIFGQKALKIDKYGVKRIGNSFEMPIEGVSQKVTVGAIDADGPTLVVNGRSVKLSFNTNP